MSHCATSIFSAWPRLKVCNDFMWLEAIFSAVVRDFNAARCVFSDLLCQSSKLGKIKAWIYEVRKVQIKLWNLLFDFTDDNLGRSSTIVPKIGRVSCVCGFGHHMMILMA